MQGRIHVGESQHTQSTLWAFVTAYRAATGESLSYLRLVQDGNYLRHVLREGRDSGDPALRDLAGRLERSLPEDGEAPPGGASSPPSADSGAGGRRGPVEEYAEAVAAALARAELLSLDDREGLDRLARRGHLDADTTSAIERDTRGRAGVAPLNWRDELYANVCRLQADGELDERGRLRVYATYIRRGRLSVAHAEAVMAELAPPEGEGGTVDERGGRRGQWGIVAGVLLAGLVVAGAVAAVAGLSGAGNGGAVRLDEPITADTTWSTGTTYRLMDTVFVEDGATLTIEPGTTIEGAFGAALVITRGADIQASGRPDRPIVFTSAQPPGERRSGDWGGVVLLGGAPVNVDGAHVEGIPADDPRGAFGGDDPAHSCGVMEYVRIEFAGHEVFANNELNGLTVGGCGRNTILRHLQIHRGLDDGIEFFGGTTDLAQTLITGPGDDGLDWDMGWQGRVQNVIVQQYPGRGDNGIEADNLKGSPDARPRSGPTLYNVTLLGPGQAQGRQRGMTLRRGTGAHFHNLLVAGFPLEAVDVQGGTSASLAGSGDLSFDHTMIAMPVAAAFQPETGEADDDGGFVERDFLETAPATTLGAEPRLSPRAFSVTAPRYAPLGTSPAAGAGVAPPQSEFWDESTTYIGAVAPGDGADWTAGWTAFPEN
ncbi:hypothetical protein KBTX_03417 [wastewater metagenome]|uniref:Right handed beta helix domain-containing protein n=2 Tax=unclassified sequences TaxID=12908 RepID=A0A5B8RHK7_9ZZZZ|nr:hypothetical protein KBTEX_03417 [uncultured organism]